MGLQQPGLEPDESRTYRTKTGRVLTSADINELADEAERGYDVERLVGKPGRSRTETAAALVVPVRLDADLLRSAEARAGAEQTSLNEIVRAALRAFLAL